MAYSIMDRDGHAVSDADFWSAVDAARVVCVGEDHPNPHHHWAQLTIVDASELDVAQSERTLAAGRRAIASP